MKNYYLTALAGLLVACTQNSVSPNSNTQKPERQLTPKSTSETIQAMPNVPMITVARAGNPEGRTLMLIPGLASGPEVWDNIVGDLSDYDLRLVHVAGFAGAPAAQTDGDIMQRIASAVITELGDKPSRNPVLIGHSMGGFIALKSALLAPDDIAEIMIVDSLPYLAAMFMPGLTPKQSAQSAEAMRAQMEAQPREVFEAQQLSGLPRLAKNRASHGRIQTAMAQSNQLMVARSMAALLSSDLRDDIKSLQQPIAVFMPYDPAMGMGKDRVLSLYEQQYSKAPNAKIVPIEGSFHFIMDDQPEALKSAIQEILGETLTK